VVRISLASHLLVSANTQHLSYPILIAGAGIGGLASALALARANQDLIVLEQSPSFSEIGAGIQLGPNAWRALRRLGVAQALEGLSAFPDNIVLHDARGNRTLQTIPLAPCKERFGEAIGNCHRAHLHQVLLEACQAHPRITLRTNAKIVSANINGKLNLATESLQGRAIIAADGVRSVVRASVWPELAAPRSAMQTVRALLPMSDPELPAALRRNATQIWWARGAHAVAYPVDGGRQLNLVAFTRDSIGLASLEHTMRDTPLASLLSQPARWTAWPLWRLQSVPAWRRGKVVLLGDAAHASLPFLAQGAAMALEDAVSLGDAVAREADLSDALNSYIAQRQARTKRVQSASALMAHVDHAGGALRWARNKLLSWRAPSSTLETLAWIYEH
jgi:salicylate hydroxylase